MKIEELFEGSAVIAVVTIERLEDAVPLATALRDGGLRVIEVTLRTAAAAAAICRIADLFPELTIGAGTVTTRREVAIAEGAGARFLVSPAATERLLDTLCESGLPILPGASTATEVLNLLERRIRAAKFFPAHAAGIEMLSSLRGPFPQMRFCATGGIDEQQAPRFLALPNCPWVGGSWMLPADAIEQRDWGRVERLARHAASLRHVGASPPARPDELAVERRITHGAIEPASAAA
jgi:2-dehydro-3-deoxyphosphogluconate aldolase/(4S)-4-hydroxy-2-oxoglutarate aldolase